MTVFDFQTHLKKEYRGPYVATDIMIRHDDGKKQGIVLIERKYYPLGLAPPGGMAEYMSLPSNARKEAKEETGLDVTLDNENNPLCVLSEPDQDPRAFIVSVTYTGIGRGILKPHPDEDAKSAHIYTLDEAARLVKQADIWACPHHRKIVELYLEAVKSDSRLSRYK